MASGRSVRMATAVVALAALSLGASGCGYLKNVRDDALDCGTFAVGFVPPVVPTASRG